MTDKERDDMRALQDRLLRLAEAKHICLDLQVSCEWPGSPTLRDLYTALYPEYKSAIEYAIGYLEGEA